MAADPKPKFLIRTASKQAIAACGGNPRDAVKALIVANEFLESEICDLMQPVSHACAWKIQELHRLNAMADVTYYVALPFIATAGGIAAGEPECLNLLAVVARAEAL